MEAKRDEQCKKYIVTVCGKSFTIQKIYDSDSRKEETIKLKGNFISREGNIVNFAEISAFERDKIAERIMEALQSI